MFRLPAAELLHRDGPVHPALLEREPDLAIELLTGELQEEGAKNAMRRSSSSTRWALNSALWSCFALLHHQVRT
jgi:hypothetical protein